MNAGDALWALTTSSFLAVNSSLIEAHFFAGNDLRVDGTFASGGDISTQLMVDTAAGSTLALDPTNPRRIGNYLGSIEASAGIPGGTTVGSFAIVRTDLTLGDSMLFYWNFRNMPQLTFTEDVLILGAGDLVFELV